MVDQPKKYTPPPNRPNPAEPGKVAAAKVIQKVLQRPPIIAGGTMSVEVTIGDVTLSIKGPILQVLAILNSFFGTPDQQAKIARLQIQFGPEVSK